MIALRPGARTRRTALSYDLYLLPLGPADDFDSAMALLESLNNGRTPTNSARDARDAAKIVMKLDRRYRPFEKNFAEIARFVRTSEADARRQYDWIELNGESETGEPLAQFLFDRSQITIHCYSGTTPAELDWYVTAVCRAVDFAVVDPQSGTITRPQNRNRAAKALAYALVRVIRMIRAIRGRLFPMEK